jgi:D-3-phosphoglycerate dehydrogenase / 2-oxoglutarate reductase
MSTTTSPARILLTHTPDMLANYYGPRALAALEQLGQVTRHEGTSPMTPAEIVAAGRGCTLIIADRNTPLPADVFANADSLVAALRVAVDIRNIDVDAASASGVLVTQASRTWVPAVAEMTLGLMIDIARDISRSDRAYKSAPAVPPIRRGRQLAGATCGIIGFGPFGRRVAELAYAFGMQVLVTDPYVDAYGPGITQVPFDLLLAESDFVLPLAVATEETECLIGSRELALMKPSAYLINLSRGNLIDEAALIAALDSGRIAGAALDVGRAADQMPSFELARRHEVVATPHIAGLTAEAIEGQALDTVDQARDILAGRTPTGAVNQASAHRMSRLRS